jgi:hypothetical protein
MAMPQSGQWRTGGRGVRDMQSTLASGRWRDLIQINQIRGKPRKLVLVCDLSQCRGWTGPENPPMWWEISTAPFDQDLELAVIDSDGPHALVFPCRRILGGWMKAETKERLDVHPTHWRAWDAHGQSR